MDHQGGAWVVGLALLCISCVSPKEFTPLAPSVPQLRLPRNDVYEGSVITGALRPTFVWEASTTDFDAPLRYELQYGSDSTFSSNTTTIETSEPTFRPSEDLLVSTVPPVGRRYYWRVRACHPQICSNYSTTWWVNLGRSAKDFNGDGYADVAVGEYLYQGRGAVFIYFGGPGSAPNTVPDGMLDDSFQDDRYGDALAGGDFNGDGFGDLFVSSKDKVYGYYGGPHSTFDSSHDLLFQGTPNESFGFSLSGMGDINGDGFHDLVIGSPGSSAYGASSGRAYVYLGGTSGPLDQPDGFLNGSGRNEIFANHISSSGDIDGDGAADIVVSLGSFPDDYREKCEAKIFGLRGFDIQNPSFFSLPAETSSYCTFRAVHAGDINRDGYADLISGINSGSPVDDAQIYLGKNTISKRSDLTLYGRDEGFLFLGFVSSVGDLNGDGHDDIIVIDYYPQIARIYFSSKEGIIRPAAGQLTSTRVVSPAGDVNGDGIDDLIIGVSPSSAHILFGQSGALFEATPDWILNGGSTFGNAVL